MNNRKDDVHESGFSLLELMVAVSIVAIMVAIITPHLIGASTQASSTACQGDTKAIQAALAEYNMLHNHFPSGDSAAQLHELVTDQLLSSDALSGNYVINDTDAANVTVACVSAVNNGS